VRPADGARAALDEHLPARRSFSPTALQHLGTCPYRFYLSAILRLAPREEVEAIETLDPLQRGALVHEVQFELLSELRDAELLPVRTGHLEEAQARLDLVLDRVAERWHDELSPAIERVWLDGVASVRADLREWLRRMAVDDSGYVPWRFELAFGLKGRRDRDPGSVEEPVMLDCGIQLRGSVDMVERDGQGRLRVTDHKTGRVRVKRDAVIEGGKALQPLFYSLAVEKMFPGAEVRGGRLWYCTAAGSFEDREVELDAGPRVCAEEVAQLLESSLKDGFLPAAPEKGACTWCDYKVVCGPYEESRCKSKDAKALTRLKQLRDMA
jgi:RecB family exonuclease